MGGWSNSTVYNRPVTDRKRDFAVHSMIDITKQLDPQRVLHCELARLIWARVSVVGIKEKG